MTTFMMQLKFTDQGIRTIKDAPKRIQAARDLGKTMGIAITHIYLTAGDSDLVAILETQSGDIAKFALALSSMGNVHTRTGRAWTEAEFTKIVSELP